MTQENAAPGAPSAQPDQTGKDFAIIVTCHIVAERCAGYFCERALHYREDAFAGYPADRPLRYVMLTCGGCCGRALQRKLIHQAGLLERKEQIGKERIVVHLSSCITRSNHHGPRCPHLDYLKELVRRVNIDLREDTHLSRESCERRAAGHYD